MLEATHSSFPYSKLELHLVNKAHIQLAVQAKWGSVSGEGHRAGKRQWCRSPQCAGGSLGLQGRRTTTSLVMEAECRQHPPAPDQLRPKPPECPNHWRPKPLVHSNWPGWTPSEPKSQMARWLLIVPQQKCSPMLSNKVWCLKQAKQSKNGNGNTGVKCPVAHSWLSSWTPNLKVENTIMHSFDWKTCTN